MYLIDGRARRELDFGGVSEEFVRELGAGVRERIGVAAFNPRTWRGIKGAVRHVGAARSIKSVPRRLAAQCAGRAGR